VPKRTANNTLTYPQQTYVTAFNTSTEAFVAGNHWSSTEANALNAWLLNLSSGFQANGNKTLTNRVRAFRKLAL
jgi:hypothetical protein